MDVRGTGIKTVDFSKKMAEYGVILKDTKGTIMRVIPPLNIGREQVDEFVFAVERTLKDLER